jgi:hypothetical protein
MTTVILVVVAVAAVWFLYDIIQARVRVAFWMAYAFGRYEGETGKRVHFEGKPPWFMRGPGWENRRAEAKAKADIANRMSQATCSEEGARNRTSQDRDRT